MAFSRNTKNTGQIQAISLEFDPDFFGSEICETAILKSSVDVLVGVVFRCACSSLWRILQNKRYKSTSVLSLWK